MKCPKCDAVKTKLTSVVDERFYCRRCLICGWEWVTHRRGQRVNKEKLRMAEFALCVHNIWHKEQAIWWCHKKHAPFQAAVDCVDCKYFVDETIPEKPDDL